jgi:hypothetical protein
MILARSIPPHVGITDRLARSAWPGLVVLAALLILTALELRTLLLPTMGIALVVAVASPPSGLVIVAGLLPQRELQVLQPPGALLVLIGALMTGVILHPVHRGSAMRLSLGGVAVVMYLVVTAVTIPPLVSGARPDEIASAITVFLHLLGATLLFFCARLILETHEPWLFLGIAAASSVLAAVVGVAGFVGALDGLPLHSLLSREADGWNRAVGPFNNPNYFGAFCGLAFVMLLGLASTRNRLSWRISLVCGAVACAAGLALSLSRGGIIATTIGVLVLAYGRSRSLGLLATVTVATVAAALYPVYLDARLEQTFGVSSGAAQLEAAKSEESRLIAITGGLRLWTAAPIFGVGFGRFQALSPPFLTGTGLNYPHNWFARVLAEQGLVGAILVLLIGASVLIALNRSNHPLRSTAFAMTAVLLVFSLFGEPVLGLQTSGVVWLVFAAALQSPAVATSSLIAGQRLLGTIPKKSPGRLASPPVRRAG